MTSILQAAPATSDPSRVDAQCGDQVFDLAGVNPVREWQVSDRRYRSLTRFSGHLF